jgi:hypothetical protein
MRDVEISLLYFERASEVIVLHYNFIWRPQFRRALIGGDKRNKVDVEARHLFKGSAHFPGLANRVATNYYLN